MKHHLPTGLAGRALALGLVGVVLVVAWIAAVAPLTAWYSARAEALESHRALARRMAELADSLPALRARASGAKAGAASPSLLDGATDAIAGANLQGLLRDLARRAGATLSTVETLPAAPAGAYRRVSLRVSLIADWPVLVHLLAAAEQARPWVGIDDLQVRGARVLGRARKLPLDASFTAYSFSGGTGRSPR